MQTLAVDATTVEVLHAFGGAGLRSILLKGPSLQRELHRDGSRRSYCDTDLLVLPADLPRAAEVLTALGFNLVIDHRDHPGVSEPHAQEWARADHESLDLHWRIPGVGTSPDRAWDVLDEHSIRISIGDAVADSLSPAGIALLVALHVAHHGTTIQKPIRDLERALTQIDRRAWAGAARLASALDAEEAFAGGLRLSRAGERLAADLRLPAVQSTQRKLMAGDQPPGSLGLLGILDAPGTRDRARVMRERLLPGPAAMRVAAPLARRGRLGLALAYLLRPVVRTWQLPAAIRAVRRARRTTT
jgi:Uncharacterised nucleotidyltransferase